MTLTSPWTSDNLAETLPVLFDTFTLTDDAYIDNRIDPNYARREVLMTVPGITSDIADLIVGSSVVGPDGSAAPDLLSSHSTPGWLYMEGIVDLPLMRSVEPFLTTRGDIYRAQIIGFFEEGGPFTRVEAVIDGTEFPAKILSIQDLTNLGRGYSNVLLQLETEESTR